MKEPEQPALEGLRHACREGGRILASLRAGGEAAREWRAAPVPRPVHTGQSSVGVSDRGETAVDASAARGAMGIYTICT